MSSIPSYDRITRPLLKYLMEASEAVGLAAIREEIARMFDVTKEDQQKRLNSGERRFDNHIRWIAHDMRSAGLLRSPKLGCFEVTQEGKDEFRRGTRLSRKYLKQRHQYLKQQRQTMLPSEARDVSIKSQLVEERPLRTGIPDYNRITRPLLKYLIEANKVVELATIREEIARMFDVTEQDQQKRLNNGERRFVNRVRWVAHDMRSAGLLRSPQRGCFEVTQEGRDEFQKGTELSCKYLRQRHQYLKQQRQGILSSETESILIKPQQVEQVIGLEASDERSDLTPDEEIENALEQIDEALAVELLDRTCEIGHKRFGQLTVDLLVKMGYGKGGKRTGGPKDGSIDGIIYEDELGFIQIGIQAKCNAEDNKVSGGEMNEFSGALERKGLQKGVFVTTSSFTSDADNAAKEVTGQGRKSIITINGEQLAKLMIKHGIGCEGKPLIKNTIDKSFWQMAEK